MAERYVSKDGHVIEVWRDDYGDWHARTGNSPIDRTYGKDHKKSEVLQKERIDPEDKIEFEGDNGEGESSSPENENYDGEHSESENEKSYDSDENLKSEQSKGDESSGERDQEGDDADDESPMPPLAEEDGFIPGDEDAV